MAQTGMASAPRRPAFVIAAVVAVGVAVAIAVFVVAPLLVQHPAAQRTPASQATAQPVPTQAAAAQPSAAPTAAATSQPSLAGAFDARSGPDSVSGKATLGKTPDGRVVLSLTSLDSTPGPNLWVYLATVESPASQAQVMSGIELGKLKATKGDITYELDANADYTRYRSAVVWCKSFNVVFGYANLT